MRLEDFDYHLPQQRIAQTPLEPRDSAKLLVDRGTDEPAHRHVRDLVEHLDEGDLLVVNDSKVIPARLRLWRESGGSAEVLLLEPLERSESLESSVSLGMIGSAEATGRRWQALVRPARKLRVGERLFTSTGIALVEVGRRATAGDTTEVTIVGDGDVLDLLTEHGEMPLPPYISARLDRPDRYQTVFADQPASSAAPTAGLHFTAELLDALSRNGVELARVELVVGLDTFKPVTADDPRTHRIHSERYRVTQDVLTRCRSARRVVAVGTTSVRALESAATFGELAGRTRLFIHRPYEWKVVDMMMTNFHMPRTTLLMMIDAFVGPRWRDLYATALEDDYRFLSFGDAMLLDRRAS